MSPNQRKHSASLRGEAKRILELHWRDPGYCVPNEAVYPHQWLWDSCFHAIAWAALGSDRGVTEITNALAHQDASGFVPHMTYWSDSMAGESFWGRRMTSSITQPPMYGHAIADLVRRGVAVPDALIDQAIHGLRFLLGDRLRSSGLIEVVHPWETGCDDSARWDSWCVGGYAPQRWRAIKHALVNEPGFSVGSVGFSALVAFNAAEVLTVRPDAQLKAQTEALVAAIATRWDETRATWVDDEVATRPSGAARTLDGLLPVLVLDSPPVDIAFDQIIDPSCFGGVCGPAATHRDEPGFEPLAYWRGSAWPQLSYLCWVAATRHDRGDVASYCADALIAGAERSTFAEYWHPDTGQAGGARPQTWATIAAAVA